MQQHSRWVWAGVLALGWLLDLLFWKQAPGINFPVYVALCIAGGLIIVGRDRIMAAPASLWLVPPIVLLGFTSFLRLEPLTAFLGMVLTLFLMALLAISYRGGGWHRYTVADYFLGMLRLAWSMLSKPWTFRNQRAPGGKGGRERGAGLWPIVRGVLLALPVVLVFAGLLGSADLVFRRELDEFVSLLSLERLPEYIFRLVYILMAAFALLGVFLHAASDESAVPLRRGDRPWIPNFLGFTEAAIVLGAVSILFTAFVAVQFQYFFGGSANINLDGYTYSEYARRGYGELLTVGLFSLLMILGLGAVTRRAAALQQRLFSGLSVLIVSLVAVMLVSAYMRLSLYEAAYGFTRLRTYVHASLVWLGILLIAVALLELRRLERRFALAALVTSIGFSLTLTVLNVDAFIARQNVSRAVNGEELDAPYLASLSPDSVPALAGRFAADGLPAKTRDAVGAVLVCHAKALGSRHRADWRSFTLSRHRAIQSLDALEAALGDYSWSDEDGMGQVIAPSGATYGCAPPWD